MYLKEKENLMASVRIREKSWAARMAAWKLNGTAAALVFGNTIYLHNITKEDFLEDARWVKHELKHIQQYQQLGKLRFVSLYFIEWLRKGYYNNRFEVEAREAESA